MDEIGPNGEVSLDLALAAFALAFGVMPGTEAPEGDPGTILSGSGPLRWVLRYWEDLTQEQQSAVYSLVEPLLEDQANALSAPGFILAAAAPVLQPSGDPSGSSGWVPFCAGDEDLESIVETIKLQLSQFAGRDLSVPTKVCRDGSTSYVVPLNAEEQPTGTMARCVIALPDGVEPQQIHTRQILAYEMYGCFQADLLAIDNWLALPPWLGEAPRRFAAGVVSDDTDVQDGSWNFWLRTPTRSLFTRNNDALGFYVLLDDADQDPGPTIDRMLIQWPAGGNEAAYLAATESDQVLDEWGSSYFGEAGLGDPWVFDASGYVGNVNMVVAEYEIYDGWAQILAAEPHAAASYEVDFQSDVVVFGPPAGPMGLVWEAEAESHTTDAIGIEASAWARLIFTHELALEGEDVDDIFAHGWVRMPDKTEHRLADLSGTSFCTVPGGCTCPPGSPGESLQTEPADRGRALVGITGHTRGAYYTVSGRSFDEFCQADLGFGQLQTYFLTGGHWSFVSKGGVTNSGCPWPGASASGTFSYDPDDLIGNTENRLVFDVTADRVMYRAFASSDGKTGTVTVPACPDRNRQAYDAELSAVVIWMFPGWDMEWSPVTGDTITGEWVWGNPINVSSWTIRRGLQANR